MPSSRAAAAAEPPCPFAHAAKKIEGKEQPSKRRGTPSDAAGDDDPEAPKKEDIKAAVDSARSNFNRRMNSFFRSGLGRLTGGKKKKKADGGGGSPRRQSKRARSTPASVAEATSTDTPHAPPSSLRPIPFGGVAFDEDTAVVRPHGRLRMSHQSPYYKRLLPSQIVKITHDAEIIVVIPPDTESTPRIDRDARDNICKAIDPALLSTSTNLSALEKEEQRVILWRQHSIERDGRTGYEFPARVNRYPERTKMETGMMGTADVDALWGDISLYVGIVGYATSKPAQLLMCNIHAVEVYELVRDGEVLNPEIDFSKGDIDEKLLKLLDATHGCTVSTVEVFMRYYQEQSNRKTRKINDLYRQLERLKAQAKANGSAPAPCKATDSREIFINILKDELHPKRLYAFADVVENLYGAHYRALYTQFRRLNANLIDDPTKHVVLYRKMKEMFPHTHAFFAMLVSNNRTKSVELAAMFTSFSVVQIDPVEIGDVESFWDD